ncbi:PA-phosphatase, partial [Halobacteriales archaeon QH_10_67_13]
MLFDPEVVEAVVEATPDPVAAAFLVCSFAGSAVVIGPAAAAAYLLGDRRTTATWIGIVAGFYAVMAAAKPFFGTPRPMVAPPFPEAALPTVLEPLYASAEPATGDAFPSGHTIAATVFWGLVAVDLEIGRRRHRL